LKPWIFIAGILLLGSCSWLQHLGHQHGDSDHGIEHGHEHEGRQELGHPHDEHDHRMYGGWDSSQYPTAVNLYRAMNLIAETCDPADSGRPSHAEMFVATFSDAYVRYKPDSLIMLQLKEFKGNNAASVLFSGASWDEATQVQMPRLARVLDLLWADSSDFHYRARGLAENWHYRSDSHPESRMADTSFPAVEVFLKGGKYQSFSGERLFRPEFYLLDCWRP
jgi:hypothetical protein